jgi:hypothetical protein
MRDAAGAPILNVEVVIADRHGLEVDNDLHRLLGDLRALATTDLRPEFATKGRQRLNEASAEIKAIQAEAKAIQESIWEFRDKVRSFEQQEDFIAVLAHLFGVEPDAPGEWPDLEKVKPLWALFQDDQPWNEIDCRLAAVAELPQNRNPGTLPHVTLRRRWGNAATSGNGWAEPGQRRCRQRRSQGTT